MLPILIPTVAGNTRGLKNLEKQPRGQCFERQEAIPFSHYFYFKSSKSIVPLSIRPSFEPTNSLQKLHNMIRGTATSKLQQATEGSIRRQSPNRLTLAFQQMKTACPSQISAYAQCVLNEEGAGNITKGSCDSEYTMVKECFRQVRLQKVAL